MVSHANVIGYFYQAGPVVKSVMLILLAVSLISWTFIFQRYWYINARARMDKAFRKRFWSCKDVSKLYAELEEEGAKEGLSAIFCSGFKSYLFYRKKGFLPIDAIQRVMQTQQAKEEQRLNQHLSFFASVGSISPYVGLFGTVWGIMTSFQALGVAKQATISMVAPGISEALVATALGLFAAIPAVTAYNRFTNKVNTLLEDGECFQNEFISMIEQQTAVQEKASS